MGYPFVPLHPGNHGADHSMGCFEQIVVLFRPSNTDRFSKYLLFHVKPNPGSNQYTFPSNKRKKTQGQS